MNHCGDYLSHHGVKGQKWGVRNGPPYPIEDKVLRKGTRLNSVEYVYDPSADKKKWKYTYNPNDEWDSKVYRGAFSVYKSNWGQYPLKDVSYEVTRDLKMPNSQERYDAFKKVYDENKKVAVKDLTKVQGMLKQYGFDKQSDERDRKSAAVDVSNLKTEDDYKAAYDVFNHAMEDVSKFKTTKKYAKLMETKYDAMVDDNNQGDYNDAKDPIIIFNQKNLKWLNTDFIALDNMYKNYIDVRTVLNAQGKPIKL